MKRYELLSTAQHRGEVTITAPAMQEWKYGSYYLVSDVESAVARLRKIEAAAIRWHNADEDSLVNEDINLHKVIGEYIAAIAAEHPAGRNTNAAQPQK